MMDSGSSDHSKSPKFYIRKPHRPTDLICKGSPILRNQQWGGKEILICWVEQMGLVLDMRKGLIRFMWMAKINRVCQTERQEL